MKQISLIYAALVFVTCTCKFSGLKSLDTIFLPEVNRSFLLDSFQLIQKSGSKGFFVKDTSKYSPVFLQKLREAPFDTVILNGRQLYIRSKVWTGTKFISVLNLFKIPDLLPYDEMIQYYATKNDSIYNLSIKGSSYTNYEYQFSINGQLVRSGTAIISPLFFFGDETMPDYESKDSSFVIFDYFDRVNGFLRLGLETANACRATLTIFDARKKENITYPVLRRK